MIRSLDKFRERVRRILSDANCGTGQHRSCKPSQYRMSQKRAFTFVEVLFSLKQFPRKITVSVFPKRARGFTLVETVIAMAILGIALSSSFALLVHSYAIMRRTDETLYVNRLLESALEVTRNLSYSELLSQPWPVTFSTDYPVFPIYGKSVNPSATADQEYGMELAPPPGVSPNADLGRINTTLVDGVTTSQNIVKVIVSVTWQPFRLGTSTKEAVTFISRNGINKR